MSAPIIRVNNLVRYFGSFCAVNRLSFSVNAGDVVGFIGANGAGKTTTMRIMASLDIPSLGSVEIDGYDVMNEPNAVRKVVGWMPDYFGTYPNMDVWEYMDFYARAFDLRGKARRQRIHEVMDFTDLRQLAERPCDALSKGQKQRLCLGRTLLADPKVLILDEPAAGLDPKARIEFKNLVQLLKEQGKTIFISSHILSELGEMCDNLLFIDNGTLVHHGDSESLQHFEQASIKVEVKMLAPKLELERWLKAHPHFSFESEVRNRFLLSFELPEGVGKKEERIIMRDALASMQAFGLQPYEFHRLEQKLEDAFVSMLRDQPKVPKHRPVKY